MEQRKNFCLIFKESINNVLKYSEAKQLQVSIHLNHQAVTFISADDGIGFDMRAMKLLSAKSLSGNGLYNMRKRAREMKVECFIKSAPGKGTTIRLVFSVDQVS